MGKLSDNEIRQIIQKATLLQKFGEQGTSKKLDDADEEINSLYVITDDLGLPRRFVYEAYIEQSGIPVQEPMVIDNHDFNSTEVIGFAKGAIDKALLNELKGQLEYHFNTLGKVSLRSHKIIWKAKPVGLSKLIASSISPEAEFEQVGGNTQIKISQSLKTLNKLYLPAIAAAFGAFMLFAGALFGEFGNDEAPALITSVLILAGTYFYTRFINGRKKKRKRDLQELTEMLQSKIERHLKSTIGNKTNDHQKNSHQIEFPENESLGEHVDVDSKSKIKE